MRVEHETSGNPVDQIIKDGKLSRKSKGGVNVGLAEIEVMQPHRTRYTRAALGSTRVVSRRSAKVNATTDTSAVIRTRSLLKYSIKAAVHGLPRRMTELWRELVVRAVNPSNRIIDILGATVSHDLTKTSNRKIERVSRYRGSGHAA